MRRRWRRVDALLVFSFEEEAERFLRLGATMAPRKRAEEIESVLYRLYAGVECMVLDPLLEVVVRGPDGLVVLDYARERSGEK